MNTTTLNLTEANFDNLTAYWAETSKLYKMHFAGEDFSYCVNLDAEWPNRVWLHQPLTPALLQAVKEKIQGLPQPMVVPYVHQPNQDADKVFAAQGFRVAFEQIGMSLKLGNTYPHQQTRVILKPVTHSNEATLWSELFEQAFGYYISPKFVANHPKNAQFFTVYNHTNEPVGTAMLYRTQKNIAGIHMVGITPNMRRQGYAEAIMHEVLQLATVQQLEYATLQASAMGKGLYLKLGFAEGFVMKSYIL
ncbi:GNAT family N-acetyltransferase [Microscilla marina]|uniref:Acetyltransferase, gnat family n=1 Tax=Microscilla marina ATCC 23134 TaxID=313606 RepID=A1ZMZ6_MICM2|nr:GNAT family N-acetyltransferase [Microscilla marina]EAY28177.1 acetyltransferase, gnat family [Microscilla marina ATCC 23134]